jgi:hypothetical protein
MSEDINDWLREQARRAEQAETAVMDVATMAATYYVTMVKMGVPESTASYLTGVWIQATVGLGGRRPAGKGE